MKGAVWATIVFLFLISYASAHSYINSGWPTSGVWLKDGTHDINFYWHDENYLNDCGVKIEWRDTGGSTWYLQTDYKFDCVGYPQYWETVNLKVNSIVGDCKAEGPDTCRFRGYFKKSDGSYFYGPYHLLSIDLSEPTASISPNSGTSTGPMGYKITCYDYNGIGCKQATYRMIKEISGEGTVTGNWIESMYSAGDATGSADCYDYDECRITVQYKTIDYLNQESALQTSGTFLWDQRPPESTSLSSISSGTKSISVSISGASDSGVGGVKYVYRLYDSSWGLVQEVIKSDTSHTYTNLVPNTRYIAAVFTRDALGNTNYDLTSTNYKQKSTIPEVPSIRNVINYGSYIMLELDTKSNPYYTNYQVNYYSGAENQITDPSVGSEHSLDYELFDNPNTEYTFRVRALNDHYNGSWSGIKRKLAPVRPVTNLEADPHVEAIETFEELTTIPCTTNPIQVRPNGDVYFTAGVVLPALGLSHCETVYVGTGVDLDNTPLYPISTPCIPTEVVYGQIPSINSIDEYNLPSVITMNSYNYTFAYPGETNPARDFCDTVSVKLLEARQCENSIQQNPIDASIYYSVGARIYYDGAPLAECQRGVTPPVFPFTTPCVPNGNYQSDENALYLELYTYTFNGANDVNPAATYCYTLPVYFRDPESVGAILYNDTSYVRSEDYIEVGGLGTVTITSPYGKRAVLLLSTTSTSYPVCVDKKRYYFGGEGDGLFTQEPWIEEVTGLDPDTSAIGVESYANSNFIGDNSYCIGCANLVGTPANGTWTITLNGEFIDRGYHSWDNPCNTVGWDDMQGIKLHIAGKEIKYQVHTTLATAYNTVQLWNWHLTNGRHWSSEYPIFVDDFFEEYRDIYDVARIATGGTKFYDNVIQVEENPAYSSYFDVDLSPIAGGVYSSTLTNTVFSNVRNWFCSYNLLGALEMCEEVPIY